MFKADATGRKPVDVRRRDFRLRIEALRIAIAHVVDKQDEDVGFAAGPRRVGGLEYGQRHEQQGDEEWEDVFY